MAWARAGIALAVAVLALSGGEVVDPPVPSGFPGVVPAFMARAGSEGVGEAGPLRGDEAQAAIGRDRRWLAQAKRLGDSAPGWAQRTYRRSLLVLRALVGRNGAAVAGAHAGWAYVWPRDAGAVAIALASAGCLTEARRVARFLLDLELGAAARFDLAGEPIEGRAAQGDATGWVAAAARVAGIKARPPQSDWRRLADYQEKDDGEYLGNAIASGVGGPRIHSAWGADRGLVRSAGDPNSGLDTAAAWAVRPFFLPSLQPAARRTLLDLVADRESRFGLVPSEDWDGGEDPWTAPTAWTAWSLAALGERRVALSLMADLRRAATPLGLLPERVDARTGEPTSTTPLAWSHAFAILALRELWPAAPR